ncbi:hypothetical protein H5410_056350, partial [Solanum commersonii]
MTSPSKNDNLAIIPFENQECPFILPDSLVFDSSENTMAYCKGEQKSSKGQFYTTYSDEDGTPLVKFIPKRLLAILVQVTTSVQCDLDVVLLTKSTKKSRGNKNKFVPPLNTVDIINDTIEPKNDRKRKRNVSMGSSKEQVTSAKLVKKSSYNKNSDSDIEGWNALFLQGNRRRNMGKKETREFFINAVVYASSVSSKVCGWCHYVKPNWPTLEGLSLALEILYRFANDPMLEDYIRVDKGALLPLHKLLFDVVHKIILFRKQKHTEANYLGLTLMELLISQICVHDNKDHRFEYGLWLGEICEYFHVPVKEWQLQTTKDVLGEVDHAAILATYKGATVPMQRLRGSLTAKGEEIAVLK